MSKSETKSGNIGWRLSALIDSDFKSPKEKEELFDFLENRGVNPPLKSKYLTSLNTATDRYNYIYKTLESIFPSEEKQTQYAPASGPHKAMRDVTRGIKDVFKKKEDDKLKGRKEGIDKFFTDVFCTKGNGSPIEDLLNTTPKAVQVDTELNQKIQFITDLRVAILEYICQKFNCTPEEVKEAGKILGYNILDKDVAECKARLAKQQPVVPSSAGESQVVFHSAESKKDPLAELEVPLEDQEAPAVVIHPASPSANPHNIVEKTIEERLSDQFEVGGDDWDKFFRDTMKERGEYDKMKNASGLKSKHQFLFFETPPANSVFDMLDYEFFGPDSSLQLVVDKSSSPKEAADKVAMAKNLRVAVVKSLCAIFGCTATELKSNYNAIGDDIVEACEGSKSKGNKTGIKGALSSLKPKNLRKLKPESKENEK